MQYKSVKLFVFSTINLIKYQTYCSMGGAVRSAAYLAPGSSRRRGAGKNGRRRGVLRGGAKLWGHVILHDQLLTHAHDRLVRTVPQG